ncbi:MAG: fluoride efflux transporter CrcB [Candidatus Bathyarchaeia archaeon]|jgi:CrcB protein
MRVLDFALLAAGAIAGAYLRYKMVESPITVGALPVNVLVVNVVGSFLLGVFSVVSLAFNLDAKYTLFFAVGFCGSFTTMSSFELETVNLVEAHRWGLAALGVVSNVGLAFIAVIAGRILGNVVVEHII